MAVSHIKSDTIGDFTGTITGFNSQGSTVTIGATDLVRPSDWNSVHNQFYTLSGNTANASTASGTNVVLAATGGLTLSGATGTIWISGPVDNTISFFENMVPFVSNIAETWNGASISHVVYFALPQPGSFSFLRIPALMTTNSTTIATMASATASASASLVSTINAVVYSRGIGANSQSLLSVASGSAGYTFLQSISISNSTQGSYTLAHSGQVQGGGTTRTTQYSVSNTNYSFTTNQIATEFSSNRWLDVPFANSLSPGEYWLVVGMSSTTGSGGAAGLAALSNCNVRYSAHYGASQANLFFGVYGSTNLSSGPQIGGGSFSTAGGGTTSGFPISAISSSASNVRLYFQLIRSA